MRTWAVSLLLALVVFPLGARAEEDEMDGLETLAVQDRQHTMTHEFSGWIGVLPLDAFVKGLTFSGAYSVHFTDLMAWEVGQFTYSYHVDTDLKSDLASLTNPIGPTPFEVVRYYATSSIVLKPVYGKMALLNRTLLFGEFYLLAGGGYGWMTITKRPVVNAGVGFRLYAGKYLSFRFDLRDYMFVNKDDVHNELWLGLAISFSVK